MKFRVLRGAQVGNWEAGGAMGVWAPGGWWDSCRRQTPIRASRASPTTVASLVGDCLQKCLRCGKPPVNGPSLGSRLIAYREHGPPGLAGQPGGAAGAGQEWRHGDAPLSPPSVEVMRHRLVPGLCMVLEDIKAPHHESREKENMVVSRYFPEQVSSSNAPLFGLSPGHPFSNFRPTASPPRASSEQAAHIYVLVSCRRAQLVVSVSPKTAAGRCKMQLWSPPATPGSACIPLEGHGRSCPFFGRGGHQMERRTAPHCLGWAKCRVGVSPINCALVDSTCSDRQ